MVVLNNFRMVAYALAKQFSYLLAAVFWSVQHLTSNGASSRVILVIAVQLIDAYFTLFTVCLIRRRCGKTIFGVSRSTVSSFVCHFKPTGHAVTVIVVIVIGVAFVVSRSCCCHAKSAAATRSRDTRVSPKRLSEAAEAQDMCSSRWLGHWRRGAVSETTAACRLQLAPGTFASGFTESFSATHSKPLSFALTLRIACQSFATSAFTLRKVTYSHVGFGKLRLSKYIRADESITTVDCETMQARICGCMRAKYVLLAEAYLYKCFYFVVLIGSMVICQHAYS